MIFLASPASQTSFFSGFKHLHITIGGAGWPIRDTAVLFSRQ